jgi:hypothetical protein
MNRFVLHISQYSMSIQFLVRGWWLIWMSGKCWAKGYYISTDMQNEPLCYAWGTSMIYLLLIILEIVTCTTSQKVLQVLI